VNRLLAASAAPHAEASLGAKPLRLAALAGAVVSACVLLAACSRPADVPPPPKPAAPAQAARPAAPHDGVGIAWQRALSDADVDASFAQARAEGKPVFVYWGAKWCPPCNQLQATLFNRHDFIERSRAFVPVYVDGDSPGAQKLGARFKVRGYPSMVLFDSRGTELTRLPGEVDAEQYTQVLTLGMAAQRPVKAVLADARAGGDAAKALTPNDWKLLAFHSWDTDEQQTAPKAQLPELLAQLAAACPADQAQTAARLTLRAVAAAGAAAAAKAETKAVSNVGTGAATSAGTSAGASATTAAAAAAVATAAAGQHAETAARLPDAATRQQLLKWLADPVMARALMDVLTNRAAEVVQGATPAGTPQRRQLVDALVAALKRIADDTTLSRADRMTAVLARVDLARIDMPKSTKGVSKPALPLPLLAEVRDHAARADRDIKDGYERQAVIGTAAFMLEQAGLMDESDRLLKSNLARSHSPYYLMSALGANAKARGDKAEALKWYEQSFTTSEGPATRLQWGAGYLGALVELAPKEEARIEQLAQKLIAEAAAQPDVFYERSARSLQRVGTRLMAWNKEGKRGAAIKRLQAQLDAVCQKIPPTDPQRAVCDGVLKAPAKAAGTST
jgi:thiol-disulfide isomerase/thioredoxin